MTHDTRGAIADLAVLGAVSAGLYLVATKPALRRIVFRALKYGVFTAAPQLLRQEVTRAWSDSAMPQSVERRAPVPRSFSGGGNLP